MPDSNLVQLIVAATLLRPLLDELVFVGGCVTGLLITDEAAASPRPTLDVDAIAEITSYTEYAAFGERLRGLGFTEDASEGAPLCRWVDQRTVLDIMPLDEGSRVFQSLVSRSDGNSDGKPADAKSRHQDRDCPLFLATKLEAFKGRGQGDFLGSHDLEDLISLVDGRVELATTGFADALPGYLLPDAASQARINIVVQRLRDLASL